MVRVQEDDNLITTMLLVGEERTMERKMDTEEVDGETNDMKNE